jgi:metallo-beta-lactamase class B
MKIICSIPFAGRIIVLLVVCVFGIAIEIKGSEINNSVIRLTDDVTVLKLTEGIWLHTTYFDISGLSNVPANGLIVIDGKHAMMIDLPWTDKQTGVLFDWVAKEHNAAIKKVVPTHSHIDCAGGLAEAHRRGADSFALEKTVEILRQTSKPTPGNWFTERMSLSCGNTHVELTYLGGGHTIDNIVAWIPERRILFGGCLVKSLNARNLGNTEEADLINYPVTLKKVRKKYLEAKIVVPGHGRPGGIELIDHTIELCNNEN